PAASSPMLINKSPPGRYACDWTGLYLGSDGGFGWEAAKGTLTDATGAPLSAYSYRVSGSLAGVFAGANYHLNRVVLGAEGDWQWSNRTRAARSCRRPPGRTIYDLDHSERLRLIAWPLGLCIRPFPRFRNCRLGMGQPFDVLCARRRS